MSTFKPLQPRRSFLSTPAAPTSRLLPPSRPLVPISLSASEAEAPITQKQLERAARPGHSFARIPLFPPASDDAHTQGKPPQEKAESTRNKENNTGLSDHLKAGIENLSGLSLDDVQVHYNSPKPAQIQALAYTRGTEIHVGPGQERHVPHEAWHVVQQKQGRVKPTLQMQEGTINDDTQLEKEADAMGMAADQQPIQALAVQPFAKQNVPLFSGSVVQRVLDHNNQPAEGFHGDLDAGHGSRVSRAWMLNEGGLRGGVPSAEPPGYGYIRQLQLTNFWIRFHLVNNLAGGPGSADNLVPASKRDNSRYESEVEKDLKDSVDEVKVGGSYDSVFFGVEVDYGTPMPGTTARQQTNAPFFPTRLTYYQESHRKKPDTWVKEQDGETFIFTDAQPTDFGTTIDLSTITKEQLKQQVFNRYNWKDDDVAFLHSLAVARKKEFEDLIDENSKLGPEESAAAALNDIPIQPGQTAPQFGESIPDDAREALGTAIGQGFVVIR